MTSVEAKAIAAWLRQLHGHTAEAFCRHMIKHFRLENPNVVPRWENILSILETDSMTEYHLMIAQYLKEGLDKAAPGACYFATGDEATDRHQRTRSL
jgi:hypothetical protein